MRSLLRNMCFAGLFSLSFTSTTSQPPLLSHLDQNLDAQSFTIGWVPYLYILQASEYCHLHARQLTLVQSILGPQRLQWNIFLLGYDFKSRSVSWLGPELAIFAREVQAFSKYASWYKVFTPICLMCTSILQVLMGFYTFLMVFYSWLLLSHENSATRYYHIASTQFNSPNPDPIQQPVWSVYQAQGGQPSPAMSQAFRFKFWGLCMANCLTGILWQKVRVFILTTKYKPAYVPSMISLSLIVW